MGNLNPSQSFWRDKSVLVTGHTGFKGGWLCFLLEVLGAKISGLSLIPNTNPNFFELVSLQAKMSNHYIGDIRDFNLVSQVVNEINPEVIFHLAAQPLVIESYHDPIGTYQTNVIGTANLLQAIRHCGRLKAVVVATTDKVYENKETLHPYSESAALGGHDPYSSSKSCQELVVSGFYQSFLRHLEINVATVRAGNVIGGGGDWSEYRLFPDAMRAYLSGSTLEIRNPYATRPWQHVLEPLNGYLILAERLYMSSNYVGAWNFGPSDADTCSVKSVLEIISKYTHGGPTWKANPVSRGLHEAGLLSLDCSKARGLLGWSPRWMIDTAVERTCSWYLSPSSQGSLEQVTYEQIDQFLRMS